MPTQIVTSMYSSALHSPVASAVDSSVGRLLRRHVSFIREGSLESAVLPAVCSANGLDASVIPPSYGGER